MDWRPYRQDELAPAEFYYLCDFRGELFLSAEEQAPDADPETSEKIRRARVALAREAGFYFNDPDRVNIYLYRIALTPDLVHRATNMDAAMPESPLHFDTICDSAGSTYEIVSPEWKAAIETVEPNIHEFFPHEFRYCDGKIRSCYIMRSGQQLNYPASKDDLTQMTASWWRNPNDGGYRKSPKPVHARRAVLHGKHWVSYNAHAASRPLAEKLLPMIPPCMEFVPMELV